MTAGHGRTGRGSLRIRSLILLGMLLPVLGLALVAAASISDTQAERDASVRLRDAATAIRAGVDFRAAVATEEIHSTVLALAHDLGVDPDASDQIQAARVRRDLAESRAAVDAGRAERIRRGGPASSARCPPPASTPARWATDRSPASSPT